MMAVFDDISKASETVAAIIAHRVVPATLEFMDNFTIRAVEDYSHVGLPLDAAALLLVEVDGHPAQAEEDASRVEELCRQMGAMSLRVAQTVQERDKMWEARRTALSALAKLKRTVVLEDATVPRSKIPDMIRALDDISRRFDLTISTFGHAGVGQTAAQPIDELVSLTYHDPRHLEKSLGVAAQPRAVIRMNPRYRLREMVEADRCRGRGGSFNLQHYDVSASIGQRKRDNIVRAGCKVVATGCPACMLHMSDILSRSRDTILVKHTIEIYAESIE